MNQLGRMQVCTSLQTDNHASIPPLSFYKPDALPAAKATASKHWRQRFIQEYVLGIPELVDGIFHGWNSWDPIIAWLECLPVSERFSWERRCCRHRVVSKQTCQTATRDVVSSRGADTERSTAHHCLPATATATTPAYTPGQLSPLPHMGQRLTL